MPTYVVFLRAINLGPTRKFPKDAIIAAAEGAGFEDVATHINTGNVRVGTSLRSRAKVEAALEQAFREDRGFDVPTIAFTPREVGDIVADAHEVAASMPALKAHYVSLLKEAPTAALGRTAEEASTEDERLVVRGRAVHLLVSERDSYHTTGLSNAWVEKRLGVATNRNVRVIRAIAEKWC